MKESKNFQNRYLPVALMGMLVLSSCYPESIGRTGTGEITPDIPVAQEQRDASLSDVERYTDADSMQGTEKYSNTNVYEDILFFEDRVSDEERELFHQNYITIGDAVIDACAVYFPDIHLTYCSRIFIATILKESTFNQYEIHEADQPYPTIGLMQIRKSTTVDDYYQYGNTEYLKERGILFGDPSRQDMENILYNIHVGMWYISLHARSNARYAQDYCREEGEPGSIAVGLSSHRIGPTAVQEGSRRETAESYVAWIQARYLELFERENTAPKEDYFFKTLARLESLCAKK